MLFFELFLTFLMIGSFSFGGGYAIIPVIEHEVLSHGWMTTQEFIDVIAIAGMSPGPVATNSAVLVGFNIAGIPGAIVSVLGMVLPSMIIILLIAGIFYKIHNHPLVFSAFYGLKPIITALIIYSSIRFALSNNMVHTISWHTISLFCIFAGALYALMKLKKHPIYVILMSGLVGIALYG
jgi:chromate transporter